MKIKYIESSKPESVKTNEAKEQVDPEKNNGKSTRKNRKTKLISSLVQILGSAIAVGSYLFELDSQPNCIIQRIGYVISMIGSVGMIVDIVKSGESMFARLLCCFPARFRHLLLSDNEMFMLGCTAILMSSMVFSKAEARIIPSSWILFVESVYLIMSMLLIFTVHMDNKSKAEKLVEKVEIV